MKHSKILIKAFGGLLLVCLFVQAHAQKVTPITKPGEAVGKEMKMFEGSLYFTTLEDNAYKIWAYDVAKKKQRLVMKSKEDIGHFFEIDKTLLFTTDKGKPGQDGTLYYLDEHGKPLEIVMPAEAGPEVETVHGRHLEIYAYRHGFLILAPQQEPKNKFKLYRYAPKQDSARRLMPANFVVHPGLCPSPDGKLIICAVEITPPHPWENSKEFWNKFSQLFLIHNDGGEPFEKWLDHAELYDAGFQYSNRTWLNLHYKELKDKGEDVKHHTVFVITNPSEKKGTIPRQVGEAVDTSLFLFQKKICYYMSNKGSIYLVAAFEYPDNYKLKYGKLNGHDMKDFVQVQAQYVFDEVIHIITRHKAAPDYYNVWTMKYKFDTAEWLEAHMFMTVPYDESLSGTMPTVSEFRTFRDSLGFPVYLSDGPDPANNKLFKFTKNGTTRLDPNGHGVSHINAIAESWHGNLILKQKEPAMNAERLMLKCKSGSGAICSPGDRYEPGYEFEYNNMLFFSVFSAQTKRLFNWQSDGTLDGTKRMDLGDMSLQLDFSRPVIAENRVFVPGRINENEKATDQLFMIEM
jgi:hypothetical protein